jgi:hypothetical protein
VSAPSHVETAVPFIPRGYFHAPVYRWTRTEVSPWYRRAPAGGAPGGLRLTLTRDLYTPLIFEPTPTRPEASSSGSARALGSGSPSALAR